MEYCYEIVTHHRFYGENMHAHLGFNLQQVKLPRCLTSAEQHSNPIHRHATFTQTNTNLLLQAHLVHKTSRGKDKGKFDVPRIIAHTQCKQSLIGAIKTIKTPASRHAD